MGAHDCDMGVAVDRQTGGCVSMGLLREHRTAGGVLRLVAALAALAALAGAASAQIESHCLPIEVPQTLLAPWVLATYPFESQTISLPLLHESVRQKEKALGAAAPKATNLDNMAKEPRDAIRLAEESKWAEAAAAGDALLKQPGNKYDDYTWDYLANATAWARIQSGDVKGAVLAHSAAAARIQDPDVSQYHRVAATVLDRPGQTADAMKNYATLQGEIRKAYTPMVESFKQSIEPAQQPVSADARIGYLQDGYKKFRGLVAADAELAKEARVIFKKSSERLLSQSIPLEVKEGRKIVDRLTEYAATGLSESKSATWNTGLNNLWRRVQESKRLVRIYDYLMRIDLAPRGDAAFFFKDAHQLLFVPNDARLVWQEFAVSRVLQGVQQLDLRSKVPYQETSILPWGGQPGTQTDVPYTGWKPMKNIEGRVMPKK